MRIEGSAGPVADRAPFEVGRQYLVYAERRHGRLFVLRTSRTAPIAWALDEVEALGLR